MGVQQAMWSRYSQALAAMNACSARRYSTSNQALMGSDGALMRARAFEGRRRHWCVMQKQAP